MKTSASVLLLNFLVVVAFSNATGDSHYPVILRQRRQLEKIPSIKNTILKLVQDLQVASKEVINGLENFIESISDITSSFHTKLTLDVAKIRERLSGINQTVTGKINFARSAALACIKTNSEKADSILSSTVANAIDCADNRIAEIIELISDLTGKAQLALETADDALKKYKKCTDSKKILNIGACLAWVTVKTDLKTVPLFPESGILLAHIYTAVATLPTAFEGCAATTLLSTVFATGGFAVSIKKCAGFFVQ